MKRILDKQRVVCNVGEKQKYNSHATRGLPSSRVYSESRTRVLPSVLSVAEITDYVLAVEF